MACGIASCRALDKDEQLLLVGWTQRTVEQGPGWKCIPCCHIGEKRSGITLTQTEYAHIRDTTNGEERILIGPGLFFREPYEELLQHTEGNHLGPVDYLKIVDRITGERKLVKGPCLWRPEHPFETILKREVAVALKHHEYVKVIDNETGVIRVVKGEGLVYLSPYEELIGGNKNRGVRDAVNVDAHTAVLVRNTDNGQLYLETKKRLFFPGPREEIEKIQKKIVLEDHQVVILMDKDGRYIFKEGKAVKEGLFVSQRAKKEEAVVEMQEDKKEKKKKEADPERENRSFFLPPYCRLVAVRWYRTPDILQKEQDITHFDLRPQFMTYKFVARTCDNVELVIDLTFFWEINDIKKMIHKTDDLPGDICNHARSVIIQDVSQVTLEKFMAEFNEVVGKAVLQRGDVFYEDRGATVHTVEVRSIHCKDPATEKVLQEIIKETTDRLNRLQKQASENEVKLSKMRGDIEEEKLNGQLLSIRHEHHRAEALMEGEAEADQVNAFLKGLGNVPFDHQLQMWGADRKSVV